MRACEAKSSLTSCTQRALHIEGVTFGYNAESTVVSDLTAAIRPGEICTLIGPNAAGKTTLLKLVLGQLRPRAGRCAIAGENVASMKPRRRALHVSYVPQRSSLVFAFTVREVVAMGRFALGADDQAVAAALEMCDLTSLADRVYAELSMGQQQRVLLARALAQQARSGAEVNAGLRILLLDEPVSNMDLQHVDRTMRLIREQAAAGAAVLVVLHDLNLAARYADAVWLMDRGRLVAAGSPQDVLTTERLEPVYGVTLRTLDAPDGRPVFLIDGGRPSAYNVR